MTPAQMQERIDQLEAERGKSLDVFYIVRDFLTCGRPVRKRELVDVLASVPNAIARNENPSDYRFSRTDASRKDGGCHESQRQTENLPRYR